MCYCALNAFQDEKNIVHGNICAKNVLLAREGDPSQETSPFIKLSDPGIKVSLLDRNGTTVSVSESPFQLFLFVCFVLLWSGNVCTFWVLAFVYVQVTS